MSTTEAVEGTVLEIPITLVDLVTSEQQLSVALLYPDCDGAIPSQYVYVYDKQVGAGAHSGT